MIKRHNILAITNIYVCLIFVNVFCHLFSLFIEGYLVDNVLFNNIIISILNIIIIECFYYVSNTVLVKYQFIHV